jgi:hypothetical protein
MTIAVTFFFISTRPCKQEEGDNSCCHLLLHLNKNWHIRRRRRLSSPSSSFLRDPLEKKKVMATIVTFFFIF